MESQGKRSPQVPSCGAPGSKWTSKKAAAAGKGASTRRLAHSPLRHGVLSATRTRVRLVLWSRQATGVTYKSRIKGNVFLYMRFACTIVWNELDTLDFERIFSSIWNFSRHFLISYEEIYFLFWSSKYIFFYLLLLKKNSLRIYESFIRGSR